MRQFVIHVSEETYNTILTALRYEQQRARKEGNNKNLKYLADALKEARDNVYLSKSGH